MTVKIEINDILSLIELVQGYRDFSINNGELTIYFGITDPEGYGVLDQNSSKKEFLEIKEKVLEEIKTIKEVRSLRSRIEGIKAESDKNIMSFLSNEEKLLLSIVK